MGSAALRERVVVGLRGKRDGHSPGLAAAGWRSMDSGSDGVGVASGGVGCEAAETWENRWGGKSTGGTSPAVARLEGGVSSEGCALVLIRRISIGSGLDLLAGGVLWPRSSAANKSRASRSACGTARELYGLTLRHSSSVAGLRRRK